MSGAFSRLTGDILPRKDWLFWISKDVPLPWSKAPPPDNDSGDWWLAWASSCCTSPGPLPSLLFHNGLPQQLPSPCLSLHSLPFQLIYCLYSCFLFLLSFIFSKSFLLLNFSTLIFYFLCSFLTSSTFILLTFHLIP